ncbi:MAG: hypothetical protein QOG00_254 [Pyrinomonadaceae bacterium]|nr:hypothetical protein [Pyrinomonadaceae bacterium]
MNQRLLPLVALLLFAVLMAACTPTVRAVGRGIEAGAIEAQGEIADMQKAGEIEEVTATKLTTAFHKAEVNGHELSLVVNWKAMTRAEKRRTILLYVGRFEASTRRLDEAGVLGIKSAKARKSVEDYIRDFQRGIRLARVIEATIPDDDEKPAASPTPSPSPGELVGIPVKGSGGRFGELPVNRPPNEVRAPEGARELKTKY